MYDEAGHLLSEYGIHGTLIEETVWMDDTPVAVIQPSGSTVAFYYVHTDHLNTPRKITRPSDNGLMWRWDPDTFGVLQPNANPAGLGTLTYNLRFPGQYFMNESWLVTNGFRTYDPTTGRYLESDPIGLGGGINTYAYAAGNPISNVDLLGLDPLEIIFWNKRGSGRSSFGHVSEKIGDTSYSFGERGNDVSPFNDYLAHQDFRGGEGLVIDVPPDALAQIAQLLHDYKESYGPVTNCTAPIQQALGALYGYALPNTPTADQYSIVPQALFQAIQNNFHVVQRTFYPPVTH